MVDYKSFEVLIDTPIVSVTCNKEGEISKDGFYFECPNPIEFCKDRNSCSNDCNGRGLCFNNKCECFPDYSGESCEKYKGCNDGKNEFECTGEGKDPNNNSKILGIIFLVLLLIK